MVVIPKEVNGRSSKVQELCAKFCKEKSAVSGTDEHHSGRQCLQGQKKAADHVACRRQNPKKPNENNLPFCIACLCSSAKTMFIRPMQQESHQGVKGIWRAFPGLKPVNICRVRPHPFSIKKPHRLENRAAIFEFC